MTARQQDPTLAIAQQILTKMEKEDLTLKEAIGIEKKTLEEIYALAYSYYNQGKNKEALSLFHFLMNVEPAEFKYVLGTAATFHQMKDYPNALLGFFTAWQLEPSDPTLPFYAADSMFHIGELHEAEELLKITLEMIEETGGFEALKERSSLLLQGLKAKK